MKKLSFLLFVVLVSFVPAYSIIDDTVFLDKDENPFFELKDSGLQKASTVKNVVYKPDESEKISSRRKNTRIYENVNALRDNNKESLSKSVSKNITDSTSFGAGYNSSVESGDFNDSVSLFSKYKREKFSLTSQYYQSRDDYKKGGFRGGSLSFSPEISPNKHLSLKTVSSQGLSGSAVKNQLVLSLKPFDDDRLDIQTGAGYSFADGTQCSRSQFNISTKYGF